MVRIQKNKWIKVLLLFITVILTALSLILYFKLYSNAKWGKFPVITTQISAEDAYARYVPSIQNSVSLYTDQSDIYTEERCLGGRIITGFKRDYTSSIINNSNFPMSVLVLEYQDYNKFRMLYTPRTLETGDSFELNGLDDLHSYMFLYYGEDSISNVTENISDNTFMRQYKNAIKLLCVGVVFVGLFLFVSILCTDKEKEIGQILLVIGWILTIGSLVPYFLRSKGYISDIFLLAAFVIMIFSTLFRCFSRDKDTVELNSEVWGSIIACIFSLILSMGFFYRIITSKEGDLLYPFSPAAGKNILDYLILLLTFVGLYLLIQNVLLYRLKRTNKTTIYIKHMKKQELLAFSIIMIYFVRSHMTEYVENSLWMIGIFVVGFMIVVHKIAIDCTAKRKQMVTDSSVSCCGNNQKVSIIVYAIETVLTILLFVDFIHYNTYSMDAYDTLYGAVHHMSAQYDTIISIFNGNPFDGHLEVHGHYAFFFLPALYLFGNQVRVIAITYAFFAALTYIATMFVINQNIKNNWLRVTTSVVMFSTMCTGNIQLIHRFTFSAILLFIITCHKRSNRKRWIVGGYVTCILALIWSTDAGLVNCIAWSLYIILTKVRGNQKCIKEFLKQLGMQLLVIVIEVVIFALIILLYNTMHKTDTMPNDLSIIFGEMANSEYMQYHTNDLEIGNLPGYYILVFYLIVLAYEMYYLNLFGTTKKRDLEVITVATVMGIGLYTYVINHSIDNPNAGAIFLTLNICLFLGEIIQKKEELVGTVALSKDKGILYDVGYVTLLFATGLMTSFIFARLDKLQTDIVENRVMDQSYWTQEVNKFNELVPPQTAIYRKMSGLDEIYFELGRDDIDLKLEDANYVISNKDLSELGYMLEREIYFSNYRYYLYKKID